MVTSAIKFSIKKISEALAKSAVNEFHPDAKKVTNPVFIPRLNSDENDWLRQREKERLRQEKIKENKNKREIQFSIRNWTNEDMRSAMMRRDYPHNLELKQRVTAYFKNKYPDTVKYL